MERQSEMKPLPPEAYVEAWKSDKSIRAMSTAILEEWRRKIKRGAESAWGANRPY